MHDWITRMVPASGEPFETGSLNLPVQELTLARLPESGAPHKGPDRSLSAQSNTSHASKGTPVNGADGDSCSWSGPNVAPWQRPESIFQMHAHSSQGNSNSHSQCDVIVSHDGTHESAGDGMYGSQLHVQGSAHSIGSLREKIQPSPRSTNDGEPGAARSSERLSQGSIIRGIKSGNSGDGSQGQVLVPERSRMGTEASACPAEVALQYVQQQLQSKTTGSFRQTRDEWSTSRAFSISPATSTITALGSVPPGVTEAGARLSPPTTYHSPRVVADQLLRLLSHSVPV